LACLRVGGRRERRFQYQDLINFLERQSGTTVDAIEVRGSDQGAVTKVLLDGIAINYGSHLCSLYETDLGRVKLSVPFLADGSRAGSRCFLVASKPTQDLIVSHLEEVFADTRTAINDSRLVITDGIPSSQGLYAYFEQQFLESTRQGDQFIRVLGDMAWAVDKGMSVEDLMKFERRYNHVLAKSFAVVSLCQYDARRFAGTEVLNALKNHEDTFQFPLSRFVNF
jgi:transcriptional repressor of dcmA and dcmR